MSESKNGQLGAPNPSDLSIESVAETFYITKENARFSVQDHILALTVEKDGEKLEYNRVFLHRAFPYDEPYSYISVLDRDNREIGIIARIADFDEPTQKILYDELALKYFVPIIDAVYSVKERFGFSFWKVHTTAGDMEISFRDTYRSMVRLTPTHVYMTDTNGNRFEIPDVDKLDHKSRRKIEIYL